MTIQIHDDKLHCTATSLDGTAQVLNFLEVQAAVKEQGFFHVDVATRSAFVKLGEVQSVPVEVIEAKLNGYRNESKSVWNNAPSHERSKTLAVNQIPILNLQQLLDRAKAGGRVTYHDLAEAV
jgi:hypothetical protein